MNGHTSNRTAIAIIRGMVREAEAKLELAKAENNKETMEYWFGFIDSLKQLDIFLYLDAFKEKT